MSARLTIGEGSILSLSNDHDALVSQLQGLPAELVHIEEVPHKLFAAL